MPTQTITTTGSLADRFFRPSDQPLECWDDWDHTVEEPKLGDEQTAFQPFDVATITLTLQRKRAAQIESSTRSLRAAGRVAAGWHLYVAAGPEIGRSFKLAGAVVSIGRAAQNVIKLKDESVSRHHVDLIFREGMWIVRDCGSGNGTRINGQLVTEPTALAEGDRLTVGDSELRFENGALPASPVAAVPLEEASTRCARAYAGDESVLVRAASPAVVSARATTAPLGRSLLAMLRCARLGARELPRILRSWLR